MNIKETIGKHKVKIAVSAIVIVSGVVIYKCGRWSGERAIMKGLESVMDQAKKAGKAIPILMTDSEGREIPVKVFNQITKEFEVCTECVVVV